MRWRQDVSQRVKRLESARGQRRVFGASGRDPMRERTWVLTLVRTPGPQPPVQAPSVRDGVCLRRVFQAISCLGLISSIYSRKSSLITNKAFAMGTVKPSQCVLVITWVLRSDATLRIVPFDCSTRLSQIISSYRGLPFP